VRVVLAGSKHPIKDKEEEVFQAVAVLVVSLLLQVQRAAAVAAA